MDYGGSLLIYSIGLTKSGRLAVLLKPSSRRVTLLRDEVVRVVSSVVYAFIYSRKFDTIPKYIA